MPYSRSQRPQIGVCLRPIGRDDAAQLDPDPVEHEGPMARGWDRRHGLIDDSFRRTERPEVAHLNQRSQVDHAMGGDGAVIHGRMMRLAGGASTGSNFKLTHYPPRRG